MNDTSPQRNIAQRLFTRRKTWIAIVVALIATCSYLAWGKLRGSSGNLDQYQIASVQRGDVEDLVTATGTLQPREYVDIGAQVSGQLKKIHVEIGSVVETGTLLAEIDPTVYRANVEARRASLRNQRATMIERESQLQLAQLQHTRQRNLMAGDATTTESLQEAEAAVRTAKAQIQALQAQIEQTESTLLADEANLNYAQIYAPMAGVVVSISARQGQTLNSSQQAPTLLRIADLSTMTVQTQVSEADVSRLSPDMEVYFTTLGNRGKRWYGQLRKVEPTPTVTNNVVLYNALFDVSNEQRNLLPQMTAQVFFVAAAAKDALYVPAAAVNTKRGERNANSAEGEKQAGNKQTDEAKRSGENKPQKQAAPKEQHPAEADGKPTDTAATQGNRESRRAQFAQMSEEERQAMRAKRRAQSEQSSDVPQGDRPRRDDERQGDTARRKQATTAPAGTAQVWAGVTTQRRRSGGEATIKVVNAAGKIEERKIQTGISNRVHVQVLSGLNEGDQVVVGLKPPPGAEKAQGNGGQQGQQRNALQAQSGPAGGPGGAGGGFGGGR